jgi:hypothetical protein
MQLARLAALAICFTAGASCASQETHTPEPDVDPQGRVVSHREVIRRGNRITYVARGDGWESRACGRVVRQHYREVQRPDGSWDPRLVPQDVSMQPGPFRDRLWVTALMTIAIDEDADYGSLEPPAGGERGPSWIASLQRADGSIATDADDANVDLLDHAVAALALLHHARCYRETDLREPAIRATSYLARSALRDGGWSRLALGEPELDTRTTAWAAYALHFAESFHFTDEQETIASAAAALQHNAASRHVTPQQELHRFLVESLVGAAASQWIPDADVFMIAVCEDCELEPALAHDPESLFLYSAACLHFERGSNRHAPTVRRRMELVGLLGTESEDFCWIGDSRARGGALSAYALNMMSFQLYFRGYLYCR